MVNNRPGDGLGGGGRVLRLSPHPTLTRDDKMEKVIREICLKDGCSNLCTLRDRKKGKAVYKKYCMRHCGGRSKPSAIKRNINGVNFYRRVLVNHLGSKCATCSYNDKLEIHHILPLCKGGADELKNLVLLCFICHHKIHN